jgi:hypothetical protein
MEVELKKLLSLLTGVVADLAEDTAKLMDQSAENLGTAQAVDIQNRSASIRERLAGIRTVLS